MIVAREVAGADAAGAHGAPRGAVVGVSLALGPGLHAVLGAPEDGTIALGELLAGRRPPARGTVRWEGRAPHHDPALRRRIAHLAHIPDLPDARDAERSVMAALAARGTPGGAPAARAALEAVGALPLARRRLPTLTHGEARAIDAAIALAHPDPLLVVAHEPFLDRAGPSEAAVESRLRQLAAGGACVVLLTSSPRDASRLGDDVLVLERGMIVRGASAGGSGLVDPPAWPGATPLRAELVAQLAPPDVRLGRASARAVGRLLADREATWSVSWNEPPPGVEMPATVRVAGPDEAACALALLEAIGAAGAELVALAPVPATLHEVRTATEQLRIASAWYARMHAMPAPQALVIPHPAPAIPVEGPGPTRETSVDAAIEAATADHAGGQLAEGPLAVAQHELGGTAIDERGATRQDAALAADATSVDPAAGAAPPSERGRS